MEYLTEASLGVLGLTILIAPTVMFIIQFVLVVKINKKVNKLLVKKQIPDSD